MQIQSLLLIPQLHLKLSATDGDEAFASTPN
jgi:hypothetical protein